MSGAVGFELAHDECVRADARPCAFELRTRLGARAGTHATVP